MHADPEILRHAARDRRSLAERFDAWMTAYPDAAARWWLYRAPLGLWRMGLGRIAGRAWILLTTRGRTSGLPRRVPLTPHRMGGQLYIWDPYGARSQWFRNVVADPVVTVQDTSGTWTARAVKVSDGEATELHALLERFDQHQLRAYCDGLGIADTPAAFASNRDRLHVVRLDPIPEPGPPPLPADRSWVPILALAAVAWRAGRRFRRGPDGSA